MSRFREEIIGDARLILGDCREVLPTLERVDAVVTDPPYGIGFGYEGRSDTEIEWCDLMNRVVPALRKLARGVVMPIGQQQRVEWWYRNHRPDWMICWHKGASPTLSKIGFNDFELHVVYGRAKTPIHDYFYAPTGPFTSEQQSIGHPCPKPPAYGNWLVSRFAGVNEVVLDPFLGSGTTGISCAKLGRKFIGIEIEPKYFDIACRRIEEAWKQPRLFEEPRVKPTQETLDFT
jgi:DNA modification methylase